MISKLSHVMLFAKNHDATVQWYCDKLEFTVDYHAPGEYASMHHKTMGRLAIHAAEKKLEKSGNAPLPYYSVKDLDAALAWLTARGVECEKPQQVADSPRHTWFWDPEGNCLGLEED